MDKNIPATEEFIEAAQSEVDKKRYSFRDSLSDEERIDFNKVESMVEQLNNSGRSYVLLSSPREDDRLFIRYFNLSKGARVLEGEEVSKYLDRVNAAFLAHATLYAETRPDLRVTIESLDKKSRLVITEHGAINESNPTN